MEIEDPTFSKPQEHKKNRLRDFFKMGEVGGYFFRKKDPNRPSNINIRLMHGINKLAIFVFLAAIIFWLVKRFLL